jgi:hypothetical protein
MPNTVYIKQPNGTYKKVKYIEKNVNGSLSLIEDVLPKGATGSQGLNGETGLNGIDGANGRHGLNGLDGLNGLNGVNGLDGYTPQKGIDYFDGEMGLQGQQGEIGLEGQQGEVGPQGEKGDKGDKGERGLQGPKGDKGDKGEIGLQGPQGDKGDKGLQGLRGPQGLTGETGLIGATGATGPAGKPGKDGRNGMMGPMGPKGADGVGGGSTQFRFIEELVEIKAGQQQVAYDLFITDKLIVKGADKTYTIGSETFSNDALLNIKKDIWLDGTLEVNGILTFDLPEMPIPAHINYFDFSSALTTTITTTDTWYKLNTNTTSIFSHDGFVHTNNRITNTGVKKRIKMSGIASVSAGNNDVIHFAFFINGQLWPCSEQEIVTSSGGRSSACPFHCVAELDTNDFVEVFVKNANASTNIILDNVNVIITELQY